MKRIAKYTLSLLLTFIMLFQFSEISIVSGAQEIDKAVNPVKYVDFTVPERFRDGGSWFFITSMVLYLCISALISTFGVTRPYCPSLSSVFAHRFSSF